jgi:hypothetical protein
MHIPFILSTALLSRSYTPTSPASDIDCLSPSLTLLNISYAASVIFSTPAHLAVSSATLDFNVFNPAAYDATCFASSRGGPSSAAGTYFYDTSLVYNCTEEPGQSSGADVSGEVTFGYVGWARILVVNETWQCGG